MDKTLYQHEARHSDGCQLEKISIKVKYISIIQCLLSLHLLLWSLNIFYLMFMLYFSWVIFSPSVQLFDSFSLITYCTFHVLMSFDLHHFMMQIHVFRIINMCFVEIAPSTRQLLVRSLCFRGTPILFLNSSSILRCRGSYPDIYLRQ